MLDHAASKTSGSPEWWLLRLGKRLAADAPRFDLLDAYWRGNPPMPHGNHRMREAYRRLQRLARTNFGVLVAEAVLERMKIMGFRAGGDADEEADAEAWQWWQRNALDADSGLVHRAAVVFSRAYVIVGEDPDAPGTPLVTVEDPRQVIHESAPTNRRKVVAALKTWWDDVEDAHLAVLYTPETIYYFRSAKTVKRDIETEKLWAEGGWDYDDSGDDGWAVPNPMGEVPVVPFVNRPDMKGEGLGEFEDVLDVLDRINTSILDRMVISAMQAYRQRWAKGVKLTDENGNDLAALDPGADLLWAVEDDNAQFGEFSATDLTPIVKAIESDVQYLSAITRTPPAYIMAGIVNAPLALDTVVPVPGGRSTMGELAVGDEVYDVDGLTQTVIGVSPVFEGRPCYRLGFSDGSTIVADGEHRWATTHFVDPRRPYQALSEGRRGAVRETSIVTTAEIAASLHTRLGTHNHHIDVASAPDGPEQTYDINPYVLGVWLGNGDRVNGLITAHVDDADEMAEHLRDCGERVDVRPYADADAEHRNCRFVCIRHDRERCPYGHLRRDGHTTCHDCDRIRTLAKHHDIEPELPARTNISFKARLKAADLWRNKHIPERYFHGSLKQRLALLQGLMDTDGTVKRGQGGVELSFHDERLSHDAHRLIQSLGQKATLRERAFKATNKGAAGVRWRLVWSSREPLFKLGRKAALQKTEFGTERDQTPFRRYIIAVERVDSVPVRCITVSGQAHLFLVTDALIATGNSGDALSMSEAGLTSKILERQHEYGQSWERVYKLAASLQGRTIAHDAEVLWRDPQFRSLTELASASVQLKAAEVPWRTRMRRLDMTPAEIDRMEIERAQDAMFEMLSQAPQAITAGGRQPAGQQVTPEMELAEALRDGDTEPGQITTTGTDSTTNPNTSQASNTKPGSNITWRELYERARAAGIRNASSMTKAQLMALVGG